MITLKRVIELLEDSDGEELSLWVENPCTQEGFEQFDCDSIVKGNHVWYLAHTDTPYTHNINDCHEEKPQPKSLYDKFCEIWDSSNDSPRALQSVKRLFDSHQAQLESIMKEDAK